MGKRTDIFSGRLSHASGPRTLHWAVQEVALRRRFEARKKTNIFFVAPNLTRMSIVPSGPAARSPLAAARATGTASRLRRSASRSALSGRSPHSGMRITAQDRLRTLDIEQSFKM